MTNEYLSIMKMLILSANPINLHEIAGHYEKFNSIIYEFLLKVMSFSYS